jgi:hypothetical protein
MPKAEAWCHRGRQAGEACVALPANMHRDLLAYDEALAREPGRRS